MTGYLLDTNLLSEIIRKRPSPDVMQRLHEARNERLTTSVVCVTELRYGAARHPQGETLWRRIAEDVLSKVEILPLAQHGAVIAGDFLAHLARQGTPIGVEDVLIGATARAQDLTVVTRNTRHFSRLPGVRIESWWSETSSR